MQSLITSHRVFFHTSKQLTEISDETIHLVVTSPPYPMIEMWDDIFSEQNQKIRDLLITGEGNKAFILMHEELQYIWQEISRVLIPGGIVCINIGDATRRIGKKFQLYPSHAEIIRRFQKLGFQSLPEIIWRKSTNSPTKFMGSGMLPSNAYVTLEHEFILIFRKQGKREFKTEENIEKRRKSAYFWEERNEWFSDVWKFKGISQSLFDNKSGKKKKEKKTSSLNGLENKIRMRSGAFPFELPWRLIHMYSIQGDYILDPFLGTGTTMFAAMCAARNSIGYELEGRFSTIIIERLQEIRKLSQKLVHNRIKTHEIFIKNRINAGKIPKYFNNNINLHVITNQERLCSFPIISKIRKKNQNEYECEYFLN
ncbi:MAG: site-specific DNA-methyltransferase [Candidatus Lokiarchaeota archaeon]|nr:site-specific DNA-methyltransferase [Candidatus Harpocratesius repetitus]